MKEIKRYNLAPSINKEGFAEAEEVEYRKGDYIKYTDHKAVVLTMQKRIDELEKINKYMRNCHNCNMTYYLGSINPCDSCVDLKNWVAKE